MVEIIEIEKIKINNNSKFGLHVIAPYLGKIRLSLGKYLVKKYCIDGGTVWDPFCGSGTIPLEAWVK